MKLQAKQLMTWNVFEEEKGIISRDRYFVGDGRPTVDKKYILCI